MLPGKKFTLDDAFEILRRRAWLLVVPPAVVGFAVLMYAASLPNVYQSDMLIGIVPQRVPDAFVRSTVTLRTDERLGALTLQVTSRTVLEQLIREFDLYANERSLLPMEDVVEKMRAAIDVELERPRRGPRGPEPPHAFHVRFTYTDPDVAARVTERLGSLFVDQNTRDRGALADATNQFLESQLEDARQRLELQESRLEAFRQRHGKALPTQLSSNMQAIQSTQMQIQALVESMARDRDRKLMLERLYSEAASEPAPLAPVSTTATRPDDAVDSRGTAQQQLAAARETLARLELRLRPEHPDVRRTKRLIEDLEPRAAAEAAQADQSGAPAATVSAEETQRRQRLRQMAAEIESLDRQTKFKESEEVRLRAVVSEYQRRIEAVPGLEAEWAALTRDYDTIQAAYRELLTKSEASRLSVDLEKRQIGEHFRILDPARIPVHPISPRRGRINGFGLLAGILLGIGIGALLEFRDGSFRSEKEVMDLLSLPVLAIVPHVSTSRERARSMRIRLILGSAAALAVVAAGYLTWAMRLWNFVV